MNEQDMGRKGLKAKPKDKLETLEGDGTARKQRQRRIREENLAQ